MGANSDIEALLREFLEKQNSDDAPATRADVARLLARVERIGEKLEDFAGRTNDTLARLVVKQDMTDKRLTDLEKEAEVTGVHTLSELRAEVRQHRADKKASRVFLKRWALGLVGTGVAAALTVMVTRLLGGP